MSPIDDELRAALHGRAQTLAPSPDPLTGIERRARKIRRNRTAAAVAGSALAVAMIAVAVPALQSATSSAPNVPQVAAPSAEPDPTSRYALDPFDPWPYRGDPAVLGNGNLETFANEWTVRHGISEAVDFRPLYGELYEPSGEATLVYVAAGGDQTRWGVVRSSESGPEFLLDEELAEGTVALPAALPGDEVGLLLVVASPEVGEIQYSADGTSEFAAMESVADGVAVAPLEGDPAADRYRVLDEDGEELTAGPAPDPAAGDRAPDSSAAALDPADPWEVRGDPSLVTDEQLDALGEDWAVRHTADPSTVTVTPLHVQRHEPSATVEVVYLVRSGDGPWSWGVSALGEGRWRWYADKPLEPGTTALPAALPGDEGVERLLVVAAPWMGGALYSGDGSRDGFEPMTDVAPGVFIHPIEGDRTVDRYMVVDGNGDLDDPIAEGEVPDYQNAG